MVRDPSVKQKIARIFKIWEERSIYNEEFLADLNGLLNTVTAAKRLSNEGAVATSASSNSGSSKLTGTTATDADPDEFQSTQLIGYINNCVRLQEKTDKAFKQLSKMPEVDVETIRQSGKDREHVEGVQKEVNESVGKLEHYIHSLKQEIKVRNIVIAALGQADEFYRSQRGDVKTVAIAYRNFGLRIKTMKKKLDELTTTLPSPIPSPDINAPSPPPDADLELPDDNSFAQFLNGSSGSFIGSALPFNLSDFIDEEPRNPIQVISSRGENDEDEDDDSHLHSSYKSSNLPPQPVPPVATGSNLLFGQSNSNNNSNNSVFSSTSHHNQSAYSPSNYGTPYSSNTSLTAPLQPPPMPPHLGESEEYTPSSSWNSHTNSWSTGMANKTPSSPSFFDRKGSAPVAEYNEDGLSSGSNDVDQRAHNPLLSKSE